MTKVWDIAAWADNTWDWDAWADIVPLSVLIATVSIQPVYSGTITVARSLKSGAEPSIDPALEADVEIKPET